MYATKKKLTERTLAATNCLLGTSLSLQLHTLADLVPVERKIIVQITNSQSAITRKGSIISACIVGRCPYLSRFGVREVMLYPRTDDAEVTANFIGIAPVVEGPVVELPIHDNDLIKKGSSALQN